MSAGRYQLMGTLRVVLHCFTASLVGCYVKSLVVAPSIVVGPVVGRQHLGVL